MTSRPAILGGPPAITLDQREANRWPIITAEDEAAVLDVLRSGDLTSNPVTRALEQDYREYFGVRHALSHCNGTVALLAAFFAIGLRPGERSDRAFGDVVVVRPAHDVARGGAHLCRDRARARRIGSA